MSDMGKETIEVMVTGGKATAAPPLGPAVAPLKVNVQSVVDAINEKTKNVAGIQVPVKIIIDTDTKEFEIVVGTPPTSALIKKELGLKKGAKEPGAERVGDLSKEQQKKIAMAKFGSDDPNVLSQIEGTARSMGISVGKGDVSAEEKQEYEDAQKQKETDAADKQASKDASKEASKDGEAEKSKDGDKTKSKVAGKDDKPAKKGG